MGCLCEWAPQAPGQRCPKRCLENLHHGPHGPQARSSFLRGQHQERPHRSKPPHHPPRCPPQVTPTRSPQVTHPGQPPRHPPRVTHPRSATPGHFHPGHPPRVTHQLSHPITHPRTATPGHPPHYPPQDSHPGHPPWEQHQERPHPRSPTPGRCPLPAGQVSLWLLLIEEEEPGQEVTSGRVPTGPAEPGSTCPTAGPGHRSGPRTT